MRSLVQVSLMKTSFRVRNKSKRANELMLMNVYRIVLWTLISIYLTLFYFIQAMKGMPIFSILRNRLALNFYSFLQTAKIWWLFHPKMCLHSNVYASNIGSVQCKLYHPNFLFMICLKFLESTATHRTVNNRHRRAIHSKEREETISTQMPMVHSMIVYEFR